LQLLPKARLKAVTAHWGRKINIYITLEFLLSAIYT
jgi:hypothetical protein